jgi:hypothetical protein
MRNLLSVFIFGLVMLSSPASAKWHQASSEHFLIYANQSEKDIREFAENLEKYHAAMDLTNTQLFGSPPFPSISPSNRVTIFVVDRERDIKKLAGKTSRNLAGFYRSRAGASVAFVPRVKDGRGSSTSFSQIVLLHEYAHHFQLSNTVRALPTWYTEGYAEYFASAAFDKDGAVWVGRPAQHRAAELLRLRKLPLEYLFNAKAYKEYRGDSKRFDSFYGRSWALFHYLAVARLYNINSERSDDIALYLNALAKGEDPLASAQNAFGDFEQLDKELTQYINTPLTATRFPPDWIKYGAVNVSPLSEGAGEIMPLYQISRNGVSREEALELLPDIREVAQQYPDDAFVQAALAEAEYDAGNNIMAIAAADRAIISDPQNISAHIQKMYALFKIASEEEGSEAEIKARWKTALKSVTAANRIENDHPLPLIYYYNSFQQRGRKPTPLAVRGLEQALGIAPYDDGLRVSVVGQMVNQKNYEKARAYLAPLQSDPHNNGRGKRAEKLLAAIDKLENGQSPLIALEKTKAAAN